MKINSKYYLYKVVIKTDPVDVIDKPQTMRFNVGITHAFEQKVDLDGAIKVAMADAENLWMGDSYRLIVESVALVGDLVVKELID